MKKYLAILERSKTGYGAYVPDLTGCIAAGKTRKETEKLIYEAIKLHIDGLVQEGLKVPEPISEAETFVFT